MFGWEYTVLLDLLHRTSEELPNFTEINNYIKTLESLHKVARECMSTS